MKGLFTQIGKLLGRNRDSVPGTLESATGVRKVSLPPARHRSNLVAQDKSVETKAFEPGEVEPDAIFGTRIEELGPGKTVLRSSYLLNRRDDGESLTLADNSPADDEATDFDPYNSGQFDRSRNWSKHPRK